MRDRIRSIDWLHWSIVLLVFSLTGSVTIFIARFLLKTVLGLEGGFWRGPWSYRFVYVVLIPPIYSIILVSLGSLFGKSVYFRTRVVKMWSRILPIKRLARKG